MLPVTIEGSWIPPQDICKISLSEVNILKVGNPMGINFGMCR
jgi:hypothetical protein